MLLKNAFAGTANPMIMAVWSSAKVGLFWVSQSPMALFRSALSQDAPQHGRLAPRNPPLPSHPRSEQEKALALSSCVASRGGPPGGPPGRYPPGGPPPHGGPPRGRSPGRYSPARYSPGRYSPRATSGSPARSGSPAHKRRRSRCAAPLLKPAHIVHHLGALSCRDGSFARQKENSLPGGHVGGFCV